MFKGCPICDWEEEFIANNPGQKLPRRYYTIEEVQEAIDRLISGEAYEEHQRALQEYFEQQEDPLPPLRERRGGSVRLVQSFDDN